MATVSEIPTQGGQPFTEVVTWGGVSYTLFFKWNPASYCWVLDIWDQSGTTPILTGLALVTGTDVLGQFAYLPVGAQAIITVMTIGPFISPDTVPDFNNLGSDGHVYLLTP
jgi:hypothetical protein